MGHVSQHLAWMKLRNLRPATITARGYALARLRRHLGHDLIGATREELEAWQRTLTLTPVGVATEIAHAAAFYRWAVEHEHINADPTARLVRPRVPRRLPRPMSEGHLEMALEFAPGDIRLMLVLAGFAGLRAGELARLERGDIMEGAEAPVMMVDGKGGRQRVVPLSSRVLIEMAAYGLPSRGAVFRRKDGRAGGHTAQRVSAMANGYLHGVGIADTLHSLRHRFGTMVYARTPDLRVTQELLGHASPATTAGYVKFSNRRAAEAVERLAHRGLDMSDTRTSQPDQV